MTAYDLIEEIGNFHYNKYLAKIKAHVYPIVEVFNDFYGSERVDLQDTFSKDNFINVIRKCTPFSFLSATQIRTLNEDCEDTKLVDINDNIISEHYEMFKQSLKRLDFFALLDDEFEDLIYIMVYFPFVVIENEHRKTHNIRDLFVKVPLRSDGTMAGSFSLNRSTYTIYELNSNYMHSHVSGIPVYSFGEFQEPCLGSGPIKGTRNSLMVQSDIDIWKLFCLELDRYVQVESITGVPYHYLERIRYDTNSEAIEFDTISRYCMSNDNLSIFIEFTKWVVKEKILNFIYSNGTYTIGASPTEILVLLSNSFIKWYNTEGHNIFKLSLGELISRNIIGKYVIERDRLYKAKPVTVSTSNYQNSYVCTFKGEEKRLNIIESNLSEIEGTYIIPIRKVEFLLKNILYVINYRYAEKRRNCPPITGDKITTTGRETRYL